MWVVTVFEQKFIRIFEFTDHGEAKQTLARFQKNARLSFVA